MKRKNVLLVEDEELLRSSLSLFLGRCGYNVKEAEDEVQALACIKDEDFGLVITDLFLTNGSGFAVMKHLQDCCPEVRCIVITGHASLDSAIRALRKGAFDYLLKPFDYDKLKSSVERAFERRADEKYVRRVDIQKISRSYGLTKKEAFITKVVITEGPSNDEMAEQMKISRNTVKVHLRNIFKKVGVDSKTTLTTTLLSGEHK